MNQEAPEKHDVMTSLHSPTIGALAQALAKAQAVMHPAAKDRENPFFKSKYADLTSIWESVRQPLSDNGLAVIQTTALKPTLVLVTMLVHSSGEWIRSEYPVQPVKNDPQGMGSAMTYARRYALAAITGASTEDDDGEAATRNGPEPRRAEPRGATAPQPARRSEEAPRALDNRAYKLIDWTTLPYRYNLPVKKNDANGNPIDMDQVRAELKKVGVKFNAEDKHWYSAKPIKQIEEYLRPLPHPDAPIAPDTDMPHWMDDDAHSQEENNA